MPIFVCGCLEGLDKMMTTTIAQMNTTGTPPRMGTQQKTADGHAGAKVPASWYCTEAATVEFKHYKYGGKDIASYSCLSCCAVWQRQFDRRSISSLGSSLGTVELVDDDGKAEDDQKKRKYTIMLTDLALGATVTASLISAGCELKNGAPPTGIHGEARERDPEEPQTAYQWH